MARIGAVKNLLDMMVQGAFDPRIAKAGSGDPSKKGVEAVRNLTWKEDVSQAPIIPEPRSIEEFAQRNKRVPIMSSIVDRTKTDSVIHEINGVPLSRPATVQGGDDYMFLQPESGRDSIVFANQPSIANRHLQVGRAAEDKFGVPPIFAPHYMSPTGGDFSTGTAETGMAYAFEVLSPQAKKELDKLIKEKGFDVTKTRDLPNGKKESYIKNYKLPNWAGIDNPLSVLQLRNAPADIRKAIVNRLGTKNFFESEGFLSPGEMRAIVTKPELLNVRDGTFGNFGILNTAGELTPTNHWSYATGFPGEGVSPIIEAGRIGPYNFTDLQKAYARDASGIPIDTLWNSQGVPRTEALLDFNKPSSDDLTALGKNITFSVLDDEQLERFKALGMVGIPGLIAGTSSASSPEFIDRIYNPDKYPFIMNGDGSISTHRMSAEQGDDGNWYVFPTIQQMPNGELKEFVLPNGQPDNYAAMRSAAENNNMLRMKDKESALAFAEGAYKVGTPLESFDPRQRTMQDNISSMLGDKQRAGSVTNSPRNPVTGLLADAFSGVKDYLSEMPNVAEFAKGVLGSGLGAEIAGAQGKYAPIKTSPSMLGEATVGSMDSALDKLSYGDASSKLTNEEWFDLVTGGLGTAATAVKGASGVLNLGKNVAKKVASGVMEMADDATRKLGLSPQVAPSGPRGRNVDSLGFYSAVEEAAMNVQRNSGSGQSFLNDIKKAPNIKDSEIEWMGLDTWLKGKDNVTSAEVQKFIRDNKINLSEIELQNNPYGYTKDWQFDDHISELDPVIDGYEIEELQHFKKQMDYGPPKHIAHSTPNGENHREVLLTLGDDKNLSEPYVKGHYPEHKNVLAHVRAADHKSDDGAQVLLLDEIQSDWHQAGRGAPDNKGQYTNPEYITDFEGSQATKKEYQKLREKIIDTEEAFINDLDKKFLDSDAPEWHRSAIKRTGLRKILKPLEDKLLELKNKMNSYGTVPDAPLKDEWYSAAIKRMAKSASDEGYDRIALTTARTQAKRYGKYQTTPSIKYDEKADSVAFPGYETYYGPVDEQIVFLNKSSSDYATLEKLFGKELANRIRNTPVDDSEIRILKNKDGSDIEFGYDGFKHYYDNAYIKSMEKIAKKFKSRVYKGKLANGDDVTYMDITPEMKQGTKAGQPLYSAAPVAPIGGGLLSTEKENRQPSKQFGLLGV
jgi:hypothetical protein